MAMIPYILYSEILHIFETPPSGTWKLSDGVVDWLYENDIEITEKQFMTSSLDGSGGREHGILFMNDIDLMAFKLRWL